MAPVAEDGFVLINLATVEMPALKYAEKRSSASYNGHLNAAETP